MDTDLAIIGSGSAAFAAAISARRMGRTVVMVENGTIGGTCVNTGCVPSKALLAAAEARHASTTADRFPGITPSAAPQVDFAALIAGKADLVHQLQTRKYIELADWEIIAGHASFTGGPCLHIALTGGGTRDLTAEHYLIATGAAPWIPPIPGLAETDYLTSTSAMELTRLPESLLVIGGNAVGLEQAQLFARLGTKVTIVETLQRLAPFEEPEISEVLQQVLTSEGTTIHTGAIIQSVSASAHAVGAHVSGIGGERLIEAEKLLVATGRRPVTTGLNLNAVGVKTGERGQVIADEYLATSNPRIWAAGDATSPAQFVYVAAAQGSLAAANALEDAARTIDYTALPRVTFTSPAIATVGMTENQARDQGITYNTRVLNLEHVPRAIVNRDTRALVKLVADRDTGTLLGAHAIAEGAADIITAAVYALENRMTVDQIATTWHPYLTMSEALKLTAQAFSQDVTTLSCCAS